MRWDDLRVNIEQVYYLHYALTMNIVIIHILC